MSRADHDRPPRGACNPHGSRAAMACTRRRRRLALKRSSRVHPLGASSPSTCRSASRRPAVGCRPPRLWPRGIQRPVPSLFCGLGAHDPIVEPGKGLRLVMETRLRNRIKLGEQSVVSLSVRELINPMFSCRGSHMTGIVASIRAGSNTENARGLEGFAFHLSGGVPTSTAGSARSRDSLTKCRSHRPARSCPDGSSAA